MCVRERNASGAMKKLSLTYMFDSFMNFIVQFERLALFAARDFHLLAVRQFDPFCYALRLNNTAHIGRVCVYACVCRLSEIDIVI